MGQHTAILYLDSLPPQSTKGSVIRFVEQTGDLDKSKIGKIEIRGRTATVEVPADWVGRLLKSLDGARLGTNHVRARLATPTAQLSQPATGDDHFARLMWLLELEGRAEAEAALRDHSRRDRAEAENSGKSLVDLSIREESYGLGGRILITLGKRDRQRPLPWTRLGIGSPVLLSSQNSSSGDGGGWRGVVSDVGSHSIQIALSELPEFESDQPVLRLDLSSDEIVRQRQRGALERARGARGERLAVLRDVLLGKREPRFRPIASREPLNEGINESQREAVAYAMAAEDVAIIHGPPGTGKTTALVELIRQAVQRGEKVLACAPSNLGVDNLLERLIAAGTRVVRLGHPARVLPELRDHTLDLMVERQEDIKLARKLVREAHILRDRAGRYTRAKPEPGAKREMREEARQLLSDARRLESLTVQHLLDQADVVCATTTGIDSELLGQRSFDLAVIDEACQTTEPGCWIPVLRCERLVLAGDHCQLPPTVLSAEAAREGLSVSLLERLMAQDEASLSRQLITQYRMHQQIMEFSSREFYHGSLIAEDSVAAHELPDLPHVTANVWTTGPLEFIDTAGASFDEQLEPKGESRLNPQEASFVGRAVEGLLAAGVVATEIGVITPYAAQVRYLREQLAVDGLEIDTVDGFQGREKEAIILSLVRSNAEGEIGFLADVRRMNVSLTRARRKLIVIGDSATLASHSFYERWLAFIDSAGAYRTIWERDVDAGS